MTDGVLVRVANGHLAHKAVSGALVFRSAVPTVCPGVPPLSTQYVVTWTDKVPYRPSAFDPCFDYFTSGMQVLTNTAGCTWMIQHNYPSVDRGYYILSLTTLGGGDLHWNMRFTLSLSESSPSLVMARKDIGSSPVGVYTVYYRNTFAEIACGTNSLDNVVISEVS